jgi:large-conductance mechanosensitive channel
MMAKLNPPPKPGDPPPPPPDIQLLTEIRDQLKKNASAAGAR